MNRLSLLVGSLLPLVAGAVAAQEPTPPPAGDPPARVARLSYLAGTVSVQTAGDTTWTVASVNYPLTTGDRLYADRGGRSELEVGALTLRTGEGTDLTVTNLTDQFVQVGLAQGTLLVSVYQLPAGDSIEIDTPRGALTVLAPGEYRVDAPADDSTMTVAVRKGTLEWTAGGVAQTVEGGQAIVVSGINPIQLASTTLPPTDDLDSWAVDRDRALSSSPSAQYVSRDIPGYSDLDAAGTWDTDAEYGPVWYPSGLAVDWAPYRHGHWVWIDPWGWTWVEREPWGYAPFHYGRWVYARSRWGWCPGAFAGRPYYAPALVVFADGSGFGAQAWFPLGPGEPYHPWYHVDAVYRERLNAPRYGRVTNVGLNVSVTTITYRNRDRGFTAVPVTTFRSGLPISRRIMTVNQDQILRSRIAPHPFVQPGAAAAAGGSLSPVRPRERRPVWTVAPAPRQAPPLRPNQPVVVRRAVPVVRPAPEPRAGNEPARPQPILITRHAPPPQEPSFPERQRAMQNDQGRPLEPQQIDNLRRGKPAGPPRDTEVPAHTATPRPAPQPMPRPAPQPATPHPAPAPRAMPAPKAAPQHQAPKPAPAKGEERRRPGN